MASARSGAAILLFLAVACFAAGLQAQPLPPPGPPIPAARAFTPMPRWKPRRPRLRWYGGETLLIGAGTQALPLALADDADPLTLLVVGSIFVPISTMSVHLMHGDTAKGVVGLAGGYASMAAGLTIGMKVACRSGESRSCEAEGAMWGMIAGGGVGLALDALTLAWGGPITPAPRPRPAVSWAPALVPRPGGAVLGFGGRF